MAKTKSGLPEGFDLKVSSNELVTGPARLPGYLDRGAHVVPVVAEPQIDGSASQPRISERAEEPLKIEPQIPRVQESPQTVVEPKVGREETPSPVVVKKQIVPVNRLQINLSTEAQHKIGELVELIRETSAEKGVNFNDVIQALILSLYDARSHLDVSRLPLRGKWGSPTARSFPAALSEVIREAIVNHEEVSGGSPFKQVVGG